MTYFPQPRPQQYLDEDQYHGDSPAEGTSWSPTASMSLQHPQPAPAPNYHPFPGQPWGHASILQDDMLPSTNVTQTDIRQVDKDWEDMHPSVENPAAQDQPQHLQHHDHIVPDYARVAHDVTIQARVAPPAPVIDAFNDDAQQAAGGPTPAFLDGVPHQDPVPNGRASEVLRQLALLYLNDPNSQLVMIRMGPGHADEVTVDFTLKLTNL
ncbi:hypothetical protein BGY98DRAFT_1129508 [Russula aff. rugulosa BPL654]|nr:hypothetical protein BGY98DRAFT_1129508 [Russula aff. rugulosa BPL654]